MTNAKGTRNYHKNFQVKRRRRREGKTDYKHRTNMIRQDSNSYGSVKHRLVVRITNSRVICQIVGAYMEGDRVMVYADSSELPKYGINFGLTNYSAAYATGFLIGRRALTALSLDGVYGPKKIDGSYSITEDVDGEKKAPKVFLDIGLARSTKGAKVFGAMKGASDAGLNIPHSEVKFYGYKEDGSFDAQELHDRIFGHNISEYMQELRESNPEKYEVQFSDYIKKGIQPEDIPQIYKNAFDKIAEDPIKEKREIKDYSGFKKYKQPRLTYEERRQRVQAKLSAAEEE
ncbi:60S ribosomal protein L5 [Encephalitozoon hellem ATCC 50504]|uniref:Ribosomal protein L5 n=1 Tax=Encephalitozoon hellem TaxID=27973 RepID=A0A9Q9C3C9_ENCHE|nr:60S ribosomal protein L5 [Encephalitozoon hellem ATCC 50504]AFM98456.1 60S ribosomal protein L5 [Encephalitozoon hellem ATCC 50504]UTX43381.1 ribosomal protein L5 [Encephalitozoon hellem]|eukprot:XP_003887437.1 60S ribosomal protein L5 [Encephalitozoon hellem ATCC 50504]